MKLSFQREKKPKDFLQTKMREFSSSRFALKEILKFFMAQENIMDQKFGSM